MTSKMQFQSDRSQRSSVPGIGLRAATAALGLAVVLLLAVMATPAAQAQTFTSVHSFDGTDGVGPNGLVQATNGNFYSTAYAGGANGYGTVFTITPSGTLTTLHSFDGTDGSFLYAGGLVQATDGNLYGTTPTGGANNDGTVFRITPSGTLTTLHSFDGTDRSNPYAGLVQATNGDLYGTTYSGGTNNDGTVFKITPGGTLTMLYSFCAQTNCTDGSFPYGGLVQATNGNLYGTTCNGGANGYGTIFTITSSGALTTLHSFNDTDGAAPSAALVQATDGTFYGTTDGGGIINCGVGCGTVFTITPNGTLSTLYSFCPGGGGCTDGLGPQAALVQGTDGNFYGTTVGGGANNQGTVFEITPNGTLTTLHSFNGTDGANAYAGLIQATNGTFYGTTYDGGASNDGTVFSLRVGLKPFVETQPTSGVVGAAVSILGTNLTGATSVTFNGTAATFTVDAHSLITTTVPLGATTGRVNVITPNGTLSSNVPFRVRP